MYRGSGLQYREPSFEYTRTFLQELILAQDIQNKLSSRVCAYPKGDHYGEPVSDPECASQVQMQTLRWERREQAF